MTKIATTKTLAKFEAIGMHAQMNVHWSKANGFHVYDKKKKYLDFTSPIFVANIGHSNKVLKKSLIKTINNNLIHTYNYPTVLREKYIKSLIKNTRYFQKAFLLSGGSESVEAAMKLMRLYALKKKKRRPGIISLKGNWHGRTMGAQMLSSDINQKKWIGVKDKNIFHIDFPYPWLIKKSAPNGKEFFYKSLKNLEKRIEFKKDLCGIILETFQGWGAIFYPKDYVQAVKKFCKENKILLVFDEMQSGFGRTGKFFGFEHYNVIPDMICCGKGMGSGFPISGVLGKKEILDLAPPGSMSSTNSANPLACAAGLATLSELNSKKLVKRSYENGKFLHAGLKNIKDKYSSHIAYSFGKGLVASIIFKKNKIKNKNYNASEITNEICFECASKGLLLVRTGRESIKIGPPLTITKKEISIGLKILDGTISNVLNKLKIVEISE